LWLDQSNDTSWAPISYSLIPVTAVVFGLVYHRNLGEFLKTPFFWWCSTLIIISGANFLRLTHLDYPLSDTAVALDQVQRFLLLPSYAFLIFLSPSRNLKLLIPLLALIAPSIIIMEFFFPEFFVNDKNNPDKVRIQGFWGHTKTFVDNHNPMHRRIDFHRVSRWHGNGRCDDSVAFN